MAAHKVGEYLARIAYFKVIDSRKFTYPANDAMRVRDITTKLEFDVQGESLQEAYISASAYTKTEEVSATELARRFVGVGHLPFTVGFIKSDRTVRVLIGHLVDHEDLLGRSMVYDFEVTKGNPLRTVDHRTLQFLVCAGLRSVLKEK